MDHFYQDIVGWFDFESIYSNMVSGASEGAHFVEIGTGYGKSTAYMAVEIINSGKSIVFDTIDNHSLNLENVDLLLKLLDPVSHVVNQIRSNSNVAVDNYQDGSLDFVFIDGDHSYDSVLEDISLWYRKVKLGGYIGGHDYTYDTVKQAVITFFQEDPPLIGTSFLIQKL